MGCCKGPEHHISSQLHAVKVEVADSLVIVFEYVRRQSVCAQKLQILPWLTGRFVLIVSNCCHHPSTRLRIKRTLDC